MSEVIKQTVTMRILVCLVLVLYSITRADGWDSADAEEASWEYVWRNLEEQGGFLLDPQKDIVECYFNAFQKQGASLSKEQMKTWYESIGLLLKAGTENEKDNAAWNRAWDDLGKMKPVREYHAIWNFIWSMLLRESNDGKTIWKYFWTLILHLGVMTEDMKRLWRFAWSIVELEASNYHGGEPNAQQKAAWWYLIQILRQQINQVKDDGLSPILLLEIVRQKQGNDKNVKLENGRNVKWTYILDFIEKYKGNPPKDMNDIDKAVWRYINVIIHPTDLEKLTEGPESKDRAELYRYILFNYYNDSRTTVNPRKNRFIMIDYFNGVSTDEPPTTEPHVKSTFRDGSYIFVDFLMNLFGSSETSENPSP